MSEFDSLSDSDWLDIASRTDDDNDSISSHDELSSRPLSRRSSISFGSSHESEVEAWEGFVDESSDESAAAEPGMSPVQPLAVHATESFPTGSIPDISHDSSDDQRVKDALDQSMVGTLSASRTSTTGHSTHNSIRDLRLSFPDPLTSSRDQLNKSYTEVLKSETSPTLEDEGSTVSLNDSFISSSHGEPERSMIPSQVLHHEVPQQGCINTNMGLDIILYGTSSPIKWSFVQAFIRKAATFSGNVVLTSLDPNGGPVQTLDLRCGKDNSVLTTITVHDYTNDSLNAADIDDVIRTSLAIVYLPATTLPILSLHTAYLPVLIPVASDPTQEGSDTNLRQAAEDDWELLAVPKNRTIKLNAHKTPVFSADTLPQIESWRVFEVIHNILDTPTRTPKSGFDNAHPVHAVTFFALVSIIVGFAFHTAFRAPVPVPTGTTKNHILGIFGHNQVNRSLAIPATGTGTAVISSSPKDFALTVFNAGVTALSVTPQVNSLSRVSRITSLSVNSHTSSLSIIHTPPASPRHVVVPEPPRASSSKEVILRDVIPTSLSEVPLVPSTTATRTQKRQRSDSTSFDSASMRLVDGLSEILGATNKAINNVVMGENGVQDIVDAVDELMNAIHTQTQAIVKESKGKARAFGEEVVSRNDKARGRAKELKKKGEQFFNTASSQFIERTKIAKKRAKVLKENFIRNEAWKPYVQTEWIAKLKNAEQCLKDKPGWARRGSGDACRYCNPGGTTLYRCLAEAM